MLQTLQRVPRAAAQASKLAPVANVRLARSVSVTAWNPTRAYSRLTRQLGASSTAALYPNASRYGRLYSSKTYPPHTLITMPALSPTMTSGNIGSWQKQVGDEVTPGDVLVEIETDKAQMDFECQDEGFVAKIFIDSGSKDIAVNQAIAVLAERERKGRGSMVLIDS
ncbi:single hybrid motif-containing protein [Dimargaris cristalligena]|uniref:Single hybrid motif-containing protein n=1 Tax=Dimargaris cristalligena TaxID=215637 RepID=A0A4P9ZVN5_9FUNG|nr:single hybrid motif-containing protein [Dimargaris cristalligena]|eukprot:RKP37665.1 single hybrid motif-containing protein [Dimargaris cristalligena]